ncbi:MAG TPA: alpha/beta hydrolase [Myxococcales bacterium]|nr:alpha/beta hydrolase [Myxococcales bacterium]HBU48586.1 alpha/beta hydrolase [Myxococcales bacterium]
MRIDWKEETFAGCDGTLLFRRHAGTTEGRPVVLCDGVGCDGYIWRYLAPELVAGGYRVIHWQYRAHGFSQPPMDPDRLQISDLAGDLLALLSDMELNDTCLVGHSMGVQVVLEAWSRQPDRVAGLGLLFGSAGRPLDTFGGDDRLARWIPVMRQLARRMGKRGRAVWRGILHSRLSLLVGLATELNAQRIRPSDFIPYLDTLAEMDPVHFVDTVWAAGQHDARALLEEIDLPTLILAAEKDGFTPPRLSEAMASQIKGSVYRMLPEASHAAPLEFPDEVNEQVLSFVTSLPAKAR